MMFRVSAKATKAVTTVPFSALAVLAVLVAGSFSSVSAFSGTSSSFSSTSASPTAPTLTNANNKVSFPGLDASAFRHPLDRQLTELTDQSVFFPFSPLAQDVVRQVYSIVEQGVRLDLLSTAVKVSPKQLPQLYERLVEVCQILDIGVDVMPDLFVQSNSQANAYTLAIQTSTKSSRTTTRSGPTARPVVVVTSALVDRCSPEEIQAVLAHECGHIKCEHGLWLSLGNIVQNIPNLTPFLLPEPLSVRQWRLAAEYTCDRAALLVAQDARIVNSAMLKLTSGTSQTTNVDAFIEQCHEYNDLLEDKDATNPFVRAAVERMNRSRTHPLPVKRVVELDKWSKSNEYERIIKLGTPMSTSTTNA